MRHVPRIQAPVEYQVNNQWWIKLVATQPQDDGGSSSAGSSGECCRLPLHGSESETVSKPARTKRSIDETKMARTPDCAVQWRSSYRQASRPAGRAGRGYYAEAAILFGSDAPWKGRPSRPHGEEGDP